MNRTTPEPVKKQIGKRISRLREKKGLTALQFAQRCGFAAGDLMDIEEGNQEIRLNELLSIARNLETTIEELTKGIC